MCVCVCVCVCVSERERERDCVRERERECVCVCVCVCVCLHSGSVVFMSYTNKKKLQSNTVDSSGHVIQGSSNNTMVHCNKEIPW